MTRMIIHQPVLYVSLMSILVSRAAVPLSPDGSSDGGNSELLRATAEVYQQALDYELLIETKVTAEPGNDPPTRVLYHLAASKPHAVFVDEKVRSPTAYQVRLAADEHSVWAYSPTTRKYVEDGGDELLGQLTALHRRLFRRFEDLDRITLDIVIEKAEDVIRENGRFLHCVRVRIQPRTTSEGWEERLWIDKASHLIRRSILRQRGPLETRITATRWRMIRINVGTGFDFSFKRPKHGTRTNQIEAP
jgi:outer membrane lipoprotein-sorting protein